MTTKQQKVMKSYTDLNQSKRLAEILPTESADMYWEYDFTKHECTLKIMDEQFDDTCIRAWSLAALFDVLPKIINNETLFIETSASLWHVGYRNIYTARADNPVDACYEMIIKLHEQNIL